MDYTSKFISKLYEYISLLRPILACCPQQYYMARMDILYPTLEFFAEMDIYDKFILT